MQSLAAVLKMRIPRGRLVAGMAAILITLACPALPAYPASLAEGRRLAMGACSACHQVTQSQKPPQPVFDADEARSISAPSFAVIAEKYRGRPQALGRFIRDPKHPMPELDWDERDLRDVVAYLQSIAGGQKGKAGPPALR